MRRAIAWGIVMLLACAAAVGGDAASELPPAEAMSQPQAFSAWFARLLAARYPQAEPAVLSPLVLTAKAGGKHPITIDLDRFFSACRRPPEDRVRCYRRVSSYLPNVLPGKDGSPVTPTSIVALVRSKDYLEKASASSRDDLDKQPVARHLVGPLWVLYAYDNSQASGLLTASQYKALHLTPDQLDLTAAKNLERLLGPLDAGSLMFDGGMQVINEGNPYESSRLLLYDQWQDLARQRGAPLLVSVPVQDALVYSAAGGAGAPAALRDVNLRLVRQGSFPVSPVILRWTSTGWVEER